MIGRLLTRSQFTLVRHGQTSYNAAHRLNGDPAVAVHLDDLGRAQCAERAIELRDQPFDLAVHTPFVRTQESLDILLAGRNVPRVCIAQFGDVRLGVFEGRPVRDYRLWRTGRSAADRPDGGESRIDALARYVIAAERLLELESASLLAVLHDVPIRFIANAAHGDDPIDGPITHIGNMQVIVLAAPALTDAIDVMRARIALAGTHA
jgi:broad specificity phosphatase PhoE